MRWGVCGSLFHTWETSSLERASGVSGQEVVEDSGVGESMGNM